MSSHSGSQVRRSRTVDGVPCYSSEDSVACHPSQALVPTTQGASSATSASSSVRSRHHREVGGLVTGVPLEHYKGKTFEDVVTSVSPGVDPSDWRIMCEKWNTREEQDIFERNRQNCTHQNMTYWRGRTSIYQLKDDFVKTHLRKPNCMEVFMMGTCKDLPDSTQRWVDDESNDRFVTENAFIVIMGRDRSGRVRCIGKAETLRTWYGRGEGSSSSGGYQT
ncbi:hypothetical protein Taro_025194, partial [Colocasia esculenta]|nr:hypothetical protein [Colocasia esculenta]